MLIIDQSNIRRGSSRTYIDAASQFIERLNTADRVALTLIPGAGSNVDFTANHALVKTLLTRVTGHEETPVGPLHIGVAEAVQLIQRQDRVVMSQIGTSIIFFMLKRKIFYRILYLLGVVILLIILYEPLNEVITLLFRIEEGVSVRDQLWLMTVNIIKDYPVFGLGPGVYKYELFNYYPFMLNDFAGKVFIYFADVSEGVNLTHNIFLVFFSEMGVLGLITIISLPIVYFRIGIKVIQKYKNGSVENYYLVIALFAAGASVFFRNIINSIGILYIGGIHTDLPFWLVFSSLIYFYIKPINTETSINHPTCLSNAPSDRYSLPGHPMRPRWVGVLSYLCRRS